MKSIDIDILWQKVYRDYLGNEVSPLMMKWFKPVQPVLDGNTFILSVPDVISRDHVAQHTEAVQRALSKLTSTTFDVQVEIDARKKADMLEALRSDVKETNARQSDSNSRLNPDYTFDNFIVGSSNNFAHAACVGMASMQDNQIYNPLFLYGGSGLGKTHLAHAIGNYVNAHFPEKRVVYVKTEQFVNEFISAMMEKTYDDFRNKYRLTDVLLIDDIQFLEGKEQMTNEFFHTFNAPTNPTKHCDDVR